MFKLQSLTPLDTGVATLNVVVDALDTFELVHVPENRKRKIAWISPHPTHDVVKLPVAENLTCFLLRANDVEETLQAHPMALGLMVLEENEQLPAFVSTAAESLTKRLIIVRRQPHSLSYVELLSLLQTMLFELYRWNRLCEETVRWNGSVQALVDASSALFENWIDVTDASYTLLAHVQDMEPPDILSKQLVDMGCHSAEQVRTARDAGVFGEWAEQSGVGIFPAIDLVPFQHVTYVIKTDKVYRGHVIMVCNKREPTPGLVDLFEIFALHCERIVIGNRGQALNQAPFEGFLTHLLSSRSPRQDYIENQRSIVGIEDSSTFCFAIVDNSEGSYAEQSLLLLSNAKRALPKALAMLYESELVILFHAPDFDSLLIEDQMAKLQSFCQQYDCVGYRSNVFFAVEDLRLAYAQAKITRTYRNAIDNSDIMKEHASNRALYRFTEAFVFLLGDTSQIAQHLVEFTAQNSHLDIIERLQLDNNVCDLKMLYRYLINERKATPTADQLNMHRNNVLHRMKAIEKRYHLNLDDYFTRQYLLACYRMKINNSAHFRKLLL